MRLFKGLCFLMLVICCVGNVHAQGLQYQPLRPVSQEFNSGLNLGNPASEKLMAESSKKGFMFSLTSSLRFLDYYTVPPIGFHFEGSIANVASVGFSFGGAYSSVIYDFIEGGAMLRAAGYVFPIVGKASGNEINTYGFEPYVGVMGGYAGVYSDLTESFSGDVKIGPLVGTRYYPGDIRAFAFLFEYGMNVVGDYSATVGITFGR